MYFGKLLKLVIFYICWPQNSANVPFKSRYVTLNKPRCLIATGAQLRFSYEAFHRQWLNLYKCVKTLGNDKQLNNNYQTSYNMYGCYKSIRSREVVGAMNVGKFKAILLLSLFLLVNRTRVGQNVSCNSRTCQSNGRVICTRNKSITNVK